MADDRLDPMTLGGSGPTPGRPATPGSAPTAPGSTPVANPAAAHGYLTAELGRRQLAINAAEADLGRIVADALRAGGGTPPPEVQAELGQIAQAEQAIAELNHQLQQIDGEAEAAAANAVDPNSACPACRTPFRPGQRYCGTCGEKLHVPAPMPGGGDQTTAFQVVHAATCRRCGRDVQSDVAYCARCGWRIALSPVRWYRTKWFRLLLVGLMLYVFCVIAVRHVRGGLPISDTKAISPALLLAELIVGGSLIPLVFVAWFYERGSRDQPPLGVLVTTFVCGAILGCTAAVVLEGWIHFDGNWGFVPVGFIEEGSKIAIVLMWLRRKDLLRADKGMVIGAATGMGFAALETMQYGFFAFLQTPQGGDPLHQMTATLDARGLLAPLGHGTWTGILAAVIWFERSNGRRWYGPRVWIAYVAVSLLHALYDITIGAHVGLIPFFGGKVGIFGVLFGLVGLATMVLIIRSARRGQDPVSAFFDAAGRLTRNAGEQQWGAYPAYGFPPNYQAPGPGQPGPGYPPPNQPGGNYRGPNHAGPPPPGYGAPNPPAAGYPGPGYHPAAPPPAPAPSGPPPIPPVGGPR